MILLNNSVKLIDYKQIIINFITQQYSIQYNNDNNYLFYNQIKYEHNIKYQIAYCGYISPISITL